MNRFLIAAVSMTLMLGTGAVTAQTRYETAPVLESRPVYRLIEVSIPQEQCWDEEIAVDSYRGGEPSRTPVLISSIIGGAIGNAVGHNKSNKRVGAVVGAVLGHSIGRDIVRSSRRPAGTRYEVVRRCETIYEQRQEERLVGYDVTYLYDGEEYTVRTDSDPGREIQVRVSIQPVL